MTNTEKVAEYREEWVDRWGQEWFAEVVATAYGAELTFTVDGDRQRPRNFDSMESARRWINTVRAVPAYP